MTMPAASWKRIFVEGSAIVVSILLAFAIDAWWQDRQQHDSDLKHLQGVLYELRHHKVLLDEAITSHQATLDIGYEFFDLLSPEPTQQEAQRIAELLDLLSNFYRINAPFGSLQTATSSGALARMRDVQLAADVASWPTTIDDLLEEQDDAGQFYVFDVFARLGQRLSLHEVHANRFAYPTGRGTDEIITDVARQDPPANHLSVDYGILYDDIEVRNSIMNLMTFGQAALGEATLAIKKLDGLIERLEACIDAGGC
ncbi:MAG: hypothetical protein R3358_03190 [Woeseiaceae bacterium]|nr:hypothetical protein [Woeseiaceae bacterium]